MTEARLDILFVDDEQRILDGLRRQLHHQRAHWTMRFAMSGSEALRLLDERPADIVVSDMRMPGMSGGQLLQQVLLTHPQTARIILSGQTDQAELMRDIGCIHQYLQKPCDAAHLCGAIERTFVLAARLRQPRLRCSASRVIALPPSSRAYVALGRELAKDEPDLGRVSNIIAADPALAVKLMQLVNTAYFGMPRRITSPQDAVVLLGLRTIRAVVVAGRLFEFAAAGEPGPTHDPTRNRAAVDAIWTASVELGERAGKIAAANGANEFDQQQARLAGLLSLIGRVILMTATPDEYARVLAATTATGQSLSRAEVDVFGAPQDDVTAYALGLWAFADELVAAVAAQAAPSRLLPDARQHHPVHYVHLARAMQGATASGPLHERFELDPAYAEQSNLLARFDRQRRLAA